MGAWRSPRVLTDVGELALGAQGHGQGGRRQLRLVVRLGQPRRGVGVSQLLGLLLGRQLVPASAAAKEHGWVSATGAGGGGWQEAARPPSGAASLQGHPRQGQDDRGRPGAPPRRLGTPPGVPGVGWACCWGQSDPGLGQPGQCEIPHGTLPLSRAVTAPGGALGQGRPQNGSRRGAGVARYSRGLGPARRLTQARCPKGRKENTYEGYLSPFLGRVFRSR